MLGDEASLATFSSEVSTLEAVCLNHGSVLCELGQVT